MNDGSDKRSVWKGVAIPVATLIAGAVIAYMILAKNRAGSINMTLSGIKVQLESDVNFSDVLKTALKSNKPAVVGVLEDQGYYELKSGKAALEGVLEDHGYYKLTSDKLLTAISKLDHDEHLAKELRKMLWDLKGPFVRPKTMREADGRMLEALADLKKTTNNTREGVNKLLAALWELHLDRSGIFDHDAYPAKLKPIVEQEPSSEPLAFTCSSRGPLKSGRVIEVFAVDGSGGTVKAKVTKNPLLFNCKSSTKTDFSLLTEDTSQLITKKSITVPLGLNEAALKMMYPKGRGNIDDDEIDARFVFVLSD